MSQLNLYRYTDSESFWISAASVEDAESIYSELYDRVASDEFAARTVALPADQQLTIRDGGETETMTAGEWAMTGRGLIGATCE